MCFFKVCLYNVPVLDYLLLSEKYHRIHIHLLFFNKASLVRIAVLRLCLLFNLKSPLCSLAN